MKKNKNLKKQLIIIIVLMILFGAFGNYLRFAEKGSDATARFSEIPFTTDNYFGEEQRFSEISYEILQADTTTLRLYVDLEGNKYWLFIAYFESQEYGSQIHSPRHCLPGGGWQIKKHEPFLLELPDNNSKLVNRLKITANQTQQLMFYWFETRGGTIRGEYGLKFDLMKNSLLLRSTDAAIVRLTMPVKTNESSDEANQRAVEYFSVFHPSLMKALPFLD